MKKRQRVQSSINHIQHIHQQYNPSILWQHHILIDTQDMHPYQYASQQSIHAHHLARHGLIWSSCRSKAEHVCNLTSSNWKCQNISVQAKRSLLASWTMQHRSIQHDQSYITDQSYQEYTFLHKHMLHVRQISMTMDLFSSFDWIHDRYHIYLKRAHWCRQGDQGTNQTRVFCSYNAPRT